MSMIEAIGVAAFLLMLVVFSLCCLFWGPIVGWSLLRRIERLASQLPEDRREAFIRDALFSAKPKDSR